MEIRALQEGDDRTTFASGDLGLDRFFIEYAGQNQFRHHIGTTYVALQNRRILGYATIAPGNVESEKLSVAVRRKLPGYPLPVLRLARLAVDRTARGHGVGKALLRHVFLLAVKMSREYGCIGVIVDAKPDAMTFYEPFGFSILELNEGLLQSRPEPVAMFLPIALIAAAIV